MAEANAIAARLRGLPAPAARTKAKTPSEKNLDVFAFMQEFFKENDQLPPVAKIAEHFGLANAAADWHVQALIRLGKVERNAVGKLRFARKG